MKSLLTKAMTAMLALAVSLNSMAQDKKQMTLEELMPGGANFKYTENMFGLSWWGDNCILAGDKQVEQINVKTGSKTTLITLDEVKDILEKADIKEKLTHLYSANLPYINKKQIILTLRDKYVQIDLDTKTIVGKTNIKRGSQNRDYCTANNMLAYTIKNNLYIDGHAVTNEVEGIECGKSVHRNEFGIEKGTFWSNLGGKLAFYKMDERMVTQYPLVDVSKRFAELNQIRYPMAGMTSHKVQVGVYDVKTKKTIYLNTGDNTDRYYTNIAWSPNDKFIFLIEINRGQDEAVLWKYDAETGEKVEKLYTERHKKYVEPQHSITFLPWNENKFLYYSQRDGYNHLYLFDTAKKNKKVNVVELGEAQFEEQYSVKQITKGNFLVTDILGFNAKKKEVIVKAVNGLHSATVIVNAENGKVVRGFDKATVSALNSLVNHSGTYAIENVSNLENPRTINIVDLKTNKKVNLLTAKNPYEGYELPNVELHTIKAADGKTDLYCRMIKPANFDASKKYPVIVYVYGGPHAQMINGSWMYGARGWDLYMANKGYIMFTVDNRGSANRGLEFENVIHRQLGIEECKDQVKGIEFLNGLPYIDKERIGVHGWSFGGHMTTALMLRYPNLFKVGVAGGPVMDWAFYEIMYGERYMDTPQENKEGYDKTNMLRYAKNLKGRLMIVHDDHDDTCVPQHALSFIKACVDARTYPDLFIYPNHKHNVIGKDRVHLYTKITQYFDDFLLPKK